MNEIREWRERARILRPCKLRIKSAGALLQSGILRIQKHNGIGAASMTMLR
jgi:hypothetical protein